MTARSRGFTAFVCGGGGGGGAPQTQKRHQQEHRPQRPTESSDPTQHAKGRTGDCPGPRKGTTTRRNVTRGAGGGALHTEASHSVPFYAPPWPRQWVLSRPRRGNAQPLAPQCTRVPPPFPLTRRATPSARRVSGSLHRAPVAYARTRATRHRPRGVRTMGKVPLTRRTCRRPPRTRAAGRGLGPHPLFRGRVRTRTSHPSCCAGVRAVCHCGG